MDSYLGDNKGKLWHRKGDLEEKNVKYNHVCSGSIIVVVVLGISSTSLAVYL